MTRYSIFLPVRNGMPYIIECVESILNQSYSNFELHILDNQSSDGTADWLKTLTDHRVLLSFSDKPLSIVESWGRIKKLPKREFMTIIGHDDVLDSNFLQMISKLIEDYPDAALFQAAGRLIDSSGKTIRSCMPVPLIETAADYMQSRFSFKCDIFGTGYVARSVDYELLGGIPPFERLYFSDDALWLSIISGSYKVCGSTECFSVRIHHGSESASLPAYWGSILIGLNQFTNFLKDYVIENPELNKIFKEQGQKFLLSLHRNILIYALVDASQDGRAIMPEVVLQVEKSLMHCASTIDRQLLYSPTIKMLRVLNANFTRGLVPKLWKLYRGMKK
jgi:glycosyltransferase involved in cell wall biosynthesis